MFYIYVYVYIYGRWKCVTSVNSRFTREITGSEACKLYFFTVERCWHFGAFTPFTYPLMTKKGAGAVLLEKVKKAIKKGTSERK